MQKIVGIKLVTITSSFLLLLSLVGLLTQSNVTQMFGQYSSVQGASATQVTIQPTVDTFVRQAYPTKNYEAGIQIISDGDPKVNSLLQFNTSQVDWSKVTKAELSITATINRQVSKKIRLINTPWTASTVTWNSMPTLGDTIGTIEGQVEENVTKLYQLELAKVSAGGSTINLAIEDQSGGDSLTFKSLETGSPGAQLQLTITTTPSTTTGSTTTTVGTTTGTTTTGGPTTSGTSTTGVTTTTGGTTGGTTPPVIPDPIPVTPTPTVTAGIWASREIIQTQPTSGTQWNTVYSTASGNWGSPNIADQDSNHDNFVMAGAIVCVRTGEFCDKTRAGIVSAIGTEGNTRWLAVGRNLLGYVIAADMINLRSDGNSSSEGSRVQTWLASFLTRELPDNNTGIPEKLTAFESGSNASAQEASVYASIAAYTNDKSKLEYVWNRFRLYSCDRTSPETVIDLKAGTEYGWAHDNNNPCAVAPRGATKSYNGTSYRIDGAIMNDMRRGGTYKWEPGYTSYPWVGLEGYVPTALILARQGYPAFEVSDRAVKRTFDYLWFVKENTGKSEWFDGKRGDEATQIVNKFYGLNYPTEQSIGAGRTFGFTGYTHPTKESILSGVTSVPTDPVDPIDPVDPLVAAITAVPVSGFAPLEVSFNASASLTDSSATITSYLWTLHDNQTSNNASFSRTYTNPGEFNVSLQITDSLGRTNTISRSIIVSSPPSVAVPIISSPLPRGKLLHTVKATQISVKTNINASCKFSRTDSNFNFNATGTLFSVTGSRSHNHQISDLTAGTSYSFYVKCKTAEGGISPVSAIIEFSINSQPPDEIVSLYSPYGIYPNCIAPGVPVEAQQWWHEDSKRSGFDSNNIYSGSRHIHLGVCAPNARSVDDTQAFGGVQDFVAVVVMYNNPGKISWINAGFQDNDSGKYFVRSVTNNGTTTSDWSTQNRECEGGGVTCVNYTDPLTCSEKQCTYKVALKIDMSTCRINGLCELRIRPNLTETPPRNERAFTTLNLQINVGGNDNYRDSTAPIGRGWYSGPEYVNSSIDNYMNLFNGDYKKSIPTVKGTIKLNIRHREAIGGKSTASMRIDPSTFTGVGGTLVYEEEMRTSSLNKDNVSIDTTKLSNGVHTLFVSTQERSSVGKNFGHLKLFINVQN